LLKTQFREFYVKVTFSSALRRIVCRFVLAKLGT